VVDQNRASVEAAVRKAPRKLSIGRMNAAVATPTPEFDSLDQLRLIAKHFLDQATAEGKRRNQASRRGCKELRPKAKSLWGFANSFR
jgi:hypothetical protein